VDNRLVFAPEAQGDLESLYLYVAERPGEGAALSLVGQIETWCGEIAEVPERGARADDLFPGLRIVGFEGRAAIAFHIGLDTVTIDRILYVGRDPGPAAEARRPQGPDRFLQP